MMYARSKAFSVCAGFGITDYELVARVERVIIEAMACERERCVQEAAAELGILVGHRYVAEQVAARLRALPPTEVKP